MKYRIEKIDLPGILANRTEVELPDGAVPLKAVLLCSEYGNIYPEYEIPELIFKKEHTWVSDDTVVVYDAGLKKYTMFTRIFYLIKEEKS